MDLTKLKENLDSFNLPAFRYRQIVKNYYSGRYLNFDQMTDLSLDLRQKLSESLKLLSVTEEKTVGDESTQKALLELSDGQKIESVFMNYEDWLTVCVSSQVGCSLDCSFCATGKMGFKRNLTPEEIVDQILYWNQKLYPKYIGRVVFMGMGEPFLNWDNILTAINIINSKDGLNIGARKISISTAGVVDKIKEFADLDTQINLAISLHSADQKIRESIMPIAKKYSLTKPNNLYLGIVNKQTNERIFTKKVSQTPNVGNTVFEYTYKDKNGKSARKFGEKVIRIN